MGGSQTVCARPCWFRNFALMKDMWLNWERTVTHVSQLTWMISCSLLRFSHSTKIDGGPAGLHMAHLLLSDFYDRKSNVCSLWKLKQKKMNPVLFNQQVFLEFVMWGRPSTTASSTGEHAKSLQSCPTLCNSMDCSPPSSSVHGILQGRILNQGPCPPPWALPNPGLKPASLTSPALAGGFLTPSTTIQSRKQTWLLPVKFVI